MTKLIGYAWVSTRQLSTDRQEADLLAAGVLQEDLYIDHGDTGTRAARPLFDRAIHALEDGDTLLITTLNRLGLSSPHLLDFVHGLRDRGARLRVLNLSGKDVDTSTPTGSTLLTIMAALAQIEHDTKREPPINPINHRRNARQNHAR